MLTRTVINSPSQSTSFQRTFFSNNLYKNNEEKRKFSKTIILPQPSSFEKAFHKKGIYFLLHQARLHHLPHILKSGVLAPAAYQQEQSYGLPLEDYKNANDVYERNKKILYLTFSENYPGKNTGLGYECDENIGRVNLLFPLSILEHRYDYYINPTWDNRGKKGPDSYEPYQIQDLKYPDRKKCIANCQFAEICFYNLIDLSDVRIWTGESQKARIIEVLQKNKVAPEWMEKIEVQEVYPKIKYSPLNLTDFSHSFFSMLKNGHKHLFKNKNTEMGRSETRPPRP